MSIGFCLNLVGRDISAEPFDRVAHSPYPLFRKLQSPTSHFQHNCKLPVLDPVEISSSIWAAIFLVQLFDLIGKGHLTPLPFRACHRVQLHTPQPSLTSSFMPMSSFGKVMVRTMLILLMLLLFAIPPVFAFLVVGVFVP